MRRVLPAELESDFEREVAWGDDERHYYNPNRRKAAVLAWHLRLETVLSKASEYLPAGARIGDFASAQCNFALLLAENGFDVTAVDIHPDFLRYGQKKYTHGKFKTILANLLDYRDPEGFDGLLLGEIIEHVAYPNELLRSAAANLKLGGVLILTTPNGNQAGQPLPTYSEVTDLTALIPRQFHWGDHLFLYTADELRGLLGAAGFEVLEIIQQNSAYISQLRAVRYLLPLRWLQWLERKARTWKQRGKDSTNSLVVVARKR